MSVKYPTDYVSSDTGWNRIHVGHDLDAAGLAEDWEANHGPAPHGIITQQVHLLYAPRVKHCSKYDGVGCDSEGEWHGHWYQVAPSPDTAFTLVRDVFP